MATEAENALISQGAPLYSRGQGIVRPVVEEVPAAKNRRTKVARLVTLSNDGLIDYMARTAKWVRFDMKQKQDVPADPPGRVAGILGSRDGEWKFNPLAGVITTPTLRPDGSLLLGSGYDPATRLLLLQPPSIPDIPNKPTKDHAARAAKRLDRLLDEFPFVGPASRAVALSGLITPVVRGALALAPMHVYKAPVAGSGKTYLVDLASGIAIGRICPVITAGKTEEETEKRLGADLMTGQSIILIDNLNGDLYGDHLCQAIEGPFVKVRILGKSEMPTIESRATLFATGNNITIRNDLLRRCLLCTLDPDVERPELRTFKDKPFERILANRGHYIAAALTIVRGYLEAGQPGKLKPILSFDDWSDHVRSALVWLGYADPLDTIEKARSEDPDLIRDRRIVRAWTAAVGLDKPKLVSEFISMAGGDSSNIEDDEDFNFSQALAELGRDGRGVTARQLGNWLRQRNGRIYDGLKICAKEDKSLNSHRWWLTDNEELLLLHRKS